MVRVDPDYTIGDAGNAMRTAGARQDTIEGVADESHVGDAGDQGALGRGGLRGRKVCHPSGPYAAWAHPGDAGAVIAAGIRPYWREDIRAVRRIGSADTRFGDIEIAVGPEKEAAGIVEPRCEYAGGGDIVAGAAIADAGQLFLTGRDHKDQEQEREGMSDMPSANSSSHSHIKSCLDEGNTLRSGGKTRKNFEFNGRPGAATDTGKEAMNVVDVPNTSSVGKTGCWLTGG